MEHPKVVSTTGTTGDTSVQGHGRKYYGGTVRASGGAITVNVHDGASAAGELIDTFQVADGASVTHWFGPNGIECQTGIFMDGVANCAAHIAYHSP